MTLREFFGQASNRTKILSAAFALGILATLPLPTPAARTLWNVLVFGLWLYSGLLAWASWYRPAWIGYIWFAGHTVTALALHKLGLILPFVLSALWLVWYLLRTGREASLKQAFAVLVSVGLYFSVPARAETPKTMPDSVYPKYLSGYALKDVSSCFVVDGIPWMFRPDGKKKRLLLKDNLRHQSEAVFSLWEVYQVMDSEGFISYIFRRALANGQFESIAVKDSVYNRILTTKKGPKTVESQDLRSLVNRPALVFYHVDGSTITYIPSTVGKSLLTLQIAQGVGGRTLAPLFLRGTVCDRPDDEENTDAFTRKAIRETGGTTSGSGAAK